LDERNIEIKAREIYLGLYGHMGARWELVETKDVWHDRARDWFALHEGTRTVTK
jgi:hypothetical protein